MHSCILHAQLFGLLHSTRKHSSWELYLRDASVVTTENKLLCGNENCVLQEEEFKVSAE